MTATGSANDWNEFYKDPAPPWDISHPQPAFFRLAETGALAGALLDAGCGTGEHTILAASRGAIALGIDVSPRAIEIARRKAAERGGGAVFQVFDALRLDTLGESFDTILDSGLFHIFDDTDPHPVRHGSPSRRSPRRSPPSHVLQRPPARRLGAPTRHRS